MSFLHSKHYFMLVPILKYSAEAMAIYLHLLAQHPHVGKKIAIISQVNSKIENELLNKIVSLSEKMSSYNIILPAPNGILLSTETSNKADELV